MRRRPRRGRAEGPPNPPSRALLNKKPRLERGFLFLLPHQIIRNFIPGIGVVFACIILFPIMH